MSNQFRSLDRITIPTPCDADWDSMTGNDQVRFCEHCNLHVNNLSSMTRLDAMRLVARSKGRLCVRYVQRLDGGVLTKGVPEKLHRISRRASRIAAGAITATLSLTSAAAQTSSVTNPSVAQPVQTRAELVSFPTGSASLSGVITDVHGAVVSGATVTLMSMHGSTAFVYVTADDGTYKFSFLDAGPYRMTAEAPTFTETESPALALASNAHKTFDLALKIPELKAEVEVTTETTEVFVTQGAVSIREPEDPLIKAAFKDDLILVAELALKTADINASDKVTDTSAMAYAAGNHNREMISVLLSAGASPNSANSHGRTPLMNLNDEATVELLHDLISAGAKINERDETGETALLNASAHCSVAVVKELIDAGARIDAKDESGNTALMSAAVNQDTQVIMLLVKAGLNVDAKNDDGESALAIAAREGAGENLIALIGAGASINLKQKDLDHALVSATNHEDLKLVRVLLKAGASANAKDDDKTVLMIAAENGKPEIIKVLVDAGAELDSVNDSGWTALMFANDVENVRVLLNAGADMSIKNKDGLTALGMAIKYEQEDSVKLLRSRGAPE
jgi:ankyrin repeat protein